jgi:intracellular sulfur oxidation DsrE/DsrF family protein
MLRQTIALIGTLFLAMVATQTFAADPKTICHEGVDPSDDIDLNDEFGSGTTAITRCLSDQNKPKVVMQINLACRDSYVSHPVDEEGLPTGDDSQVSNSVGNCSNTRAYALGNIRNMIKDYEGSHGIDNWEIVAVVHSGGWGMLVKNGYEFTNLPGEGGGAPGVKTLSNQFQGQVEELLEKGVRFLFCQNTTRGMIRRGNLPTVAESAGGGGATEALINGVEYTTAGVTAIADFQTRGYSYVQP